MFFSSLCSRSLSTARVTLASAAFLFHTSPMMAYKHIDPKTFSTEQSTHILRSLGASDSLIKVNAVASEKMAAILASPMVQGMAKGTLSKEEWDKEYMRADALYIYNLGKALAIRAKKEQGKESAHMSELAEMFLGYGKHFERLKKYGLSEQDTLVCPECDQHIEFLSKDTSSIEFPVAIVTDMLPYVVFANYLLQSIEEMDNNSWLEYAKKYGDLNNKYAKEKLGKTIQIVNEILLSKKLDVNKAEELFQAGFAFEEWFIRNAFSKGFTIQATIEKTNPLTPVASTP